MTIGKITLEILDYVGVVSSYGNVRRPHLYMRRSQDERSFWVSDAHHAQTLIVVGEIGTVVTQRYTVDLLR